MRLAKIIGAVLAAVAALAVLGIVLLAWFFDPNDYKDYLSGLVEERTGRSLRVEQDLELSFFPWLAVETGGVTIGNAPGFGDRPFAAVARVAARVRLLPLLHKQIQIGTIVLDGLELNLARDAEKRGNWEDLLARADEPRTEAAPEDDAGESWLRDFELESIRIRDSAVSWRENSDEARYEISGLTLETGTIRRGAPVDVDVGFRFLDAASRLELELEARGTAELAADGTASARKLHAEFRLNGAENLQAEGSLNAELASSGPHSAVRLDAGALAAKLANPPVGPKRLELSADFASAVFDSEAQTLRFENLATDTAGIKARWQVSGERLSDQPAFEGTIDVADTPLAKVLDLLEIEAPKGVRPQSLGNVALSSAFSFALEPRRLKLSQLDARLLGLRARGDAELDGADRLQGRIDIPEFVPGDALRSLLRPSLPADVDADTVDKLALSARFDANLKTRRASFREIKAGLLDAAISGELEVVPTRKGNAYRGSVATSRFPPSKFAAAFASWLPGEIDARELGMLALNTRFAYDPDQDGLTLESTTAELFGLSGTGEIAGRALSSAPAWTGQVRVARFSARDVLRRFGQPVPDTSDREALTRATVNTRFDINAQRGRFQDLQLELDDSRISGELTVDDFENPSYGFTLAIDRVDADRYLPPRADKATAGAQTAGDLELPTDALGTLKIDGQVQVGDLGLAGLRFQEVATRIRLGNHEGRLDSARAKLYGGAFEGAFHVDAKGNEPSLALQGRASGLQLRPLIEALAGEANFSGAGDFDLNLTGRGRTVMDNVRTAGGTVGFAMRDGAINGFNLGRSLCSAYNVTQKLPAPDGNQPKETRYQLIQGTARVSDGVASSQDLLARSSFMDVSGKGKLGLAEQRLDYELEAKLTGRVDIAGCESMEPLIGDSIPLKLRGTVTDPDIAPDYGEILKRRVIEKKKDELKERAEDRLRNRLNDLLK